MSSLLNDSKKIRLVYKGEVLHWKYLEQLQEYIKDSADTYSNNYTFKHLHLEQHLALDCLVDNHDKIFALAGVFNGGRYPDGVYRVLNRLWARSDYRTGASSPFLSQTFLPEQLKEFEEIIDVAFVSIQGQKGKKFLNNTWQKIAPKWGIGWRTFPLIVKVSPSVRKAGYQYVSYTSKRNIVIWPTAGITEEEYNNLPD